jgi:hypothetical protein
MIVFFVKLVTIYKLMEHADYVNLNSLLVMYAHSADAKTANPTTTIIARLQQETASFAVDFYLVVRCVLIKQNA